jgi:hypothetical protein
MYRGKKAAAGRTRYASPQEGSFYERWRTLLSLRKHGTFLCSPEWGVVVLDDAVRRLIGDKGAAYIEISRNTHPVFKDPRLFKTRGYLNAEGAMVFSKILGEELSKRVLVQSGPRAAVYPEDREQVR